MTLSISAIAGPAASTTPRTTATTGIFALSLAQIAGAPVVAPDADPAPPGDPKAKDERDDRQDDAAGGNALPPATQAPTDPSLLAVLLPPPVTASIPTAAAVAKDTTVGAVAPDAGLSGTTPFPPSAAPTATAAPVPGNPAPDRSALLASLPATPPTDAGALSLAPDPAVPASTPVAAPIDAVSASIAALASDVTATPGAASPLPVAAQTDLSFAPSYASAPTSPIPAVVTPFPLAVAGEPNPALIAGSVMPTIASPVPTSTLYGPVPGAAISATTTVQAASASTASPIATATIPAAPPVPNALVSTAPAPARNASPITALATPVPATGVAVESTPPPTAPGTPTVAPLAGTIQIDSRSAPVVALSPAAPPALVPGTTGTIATTSAIQAFGAAMRAGLAKGPRLEPGTDARAGTVAGGVAARADQAIAVAATGDVQQAPLDLRRDQWPHAMIDRIEALRDAADATSTKIRVVPDALGPVEMSVRKDGDTLHVHFTADQAATRAILTDAQPRLAAIAEQRGLRLGGSTVDGGSTGAGAGQQQQQAATRPTAPLPSSPSVTATAADDDTRIA